MKNDITQVLIVLFAAIVMSIILGIQNKELNKIQEIRLNKLELGINESERNTEYMKKLKDLKYGDIVYLKDVGVFMKSIREIK